MTETRLVDGTIDATIVVLGHARTGKTALIHRLLGWQTSGPLTGRYEATVEDSYIREFRVRGRRCHLRLLDTAGSLAFPAMQRLWLQRASAFLLVAGRDNTRSVDTLHRLWAQIREERPHDHQRMPVAVALNKHDLPTNTWQIISPTLTTTDAGTCANQNDDSNADEGNTIESLMAQFGPAARKALVNTSALHNEGIYDLFDELWCQNETLGSQYRIHFELAETHRPSRTSLKHMSQAHTPPFIAPSSPLNAGENSATDQAKQPIKSRRFSIFVLPKSSNTGNTIAAVSNNAVGGNNVAVNFGGRKPDLCTVESGNRSSDRNSIINRRDIMHMPTGSDICLDSGQNDANVRQQRQSVTSACLEVNLTRERLNSNQFTPKESFRNRFFSQRRGENGDRKPIPPTPNPTKPIILNCAIS